MTQQRQIPFVAATMLLALAAAPRRSVAQADSAALAAQLMQADRDFDAATFARGVEGWVSFFALNGRMVTPAGPMTVGHEAIRAAMGPFFADSTNHLRWEPEMADVAASGDLGYTIGHSCRYKRSAEGDLVVSEGRYITVWRRQPDGSWKVASDGGSSRPVNPPRKTCSP